METREEQLNEKFIEGVKKTKYRYSKEREEIAVRNIIAFLTEKRTWETKSCNEVLRIVLSQMQDSCTSVTQEEDDAEHIGLLAYRQFLQRQINALEEMKDDAIPEKSIKAVVEYLNSLKGQANDEPQAIIINERINTFVNQISFAIEVASWPEQDRKDRKVLIYEFLLFLIGLILAFIGLPILGTLAIIVSIVLTIIIFFRMVNLHR